MPNEEQFDKILDEAINLRKSGKSIADILALFPEHAEGLKSLLSAANELEKIACDDETKMAFTRMLNSLPSVIPTESLGERRNPLAVGKRDFSTALRSARNNKNDETSRHNFFTLIFNYMKFLSTVRIAGVALVIVAVVGLAANLRQSGYSKDYGGLRPTSLGGGNNGSGPQMLVARNMDSANKGIKTSGQAVAESGLSAPSRMTGDESISIGYAPYQPDIMPLPPEPGYGTPPITDTREFLKTDYNSTVKTRHVAETGTRLQTLVRGYGGRVDSASFSEKFGHLSFVVPQNQFSVFKAEITSVVGKRFIVEAVSVQNMLPQKQSIEEQTKNTSSTLVELEQQRAEVVKKYDTIIKNLRGGIARDNAAIAALDKEAATTTDEARLTEIKKEKAAHVSARAGLQQRLNSETQNYQYELASLDNQIKWAKDALKNLQVQDKNLIDTVATVQGTIVVEWVSLSEMISLYTTESWPWIVLALGAVLVMVSYRRRHPPAVVAV